MKPSAFQKLATIWGRDVDFVLNVQESQRASSGQAAKIAQFEKLERQAEALRQVDAAKQSQVVKPAEKKSQLNPSSQRLQSLKPSGGGLKLNQLKTSKRAEA